MRSLFFCKRILDNHATSDDYIPIVDDAYLSWGDRTLRGIKLHFHCSLFIVHCYLACLIFLSVSYLRPVFFSLFWYCSDPVGEGTLTSVQPKLTLISYSDSIVFHIFRDHEESGSSTDFYPFSLTDRIGVGSLMFTYDFPCGIEDISRFFFETSFKEFFHTDFSDEAKSLAIFAFSIWKSGFLSDFSNFGFEQMSYRKYRFCKLLVREAREKIGLVFI
jgi:hypothetical protein